MPQETKAALEGTAFTEDEARELARLLNKVRKNNYRFPTEESFQAFHGVRSQWAPELVIGRGNMLGGKLGVGQILLTRYDGGVKEFQGLWHIPGGYDNFLAQDLQTDCDLIAKRELGFGVNYMGLLGQHKWTPEEHPYGRPLSLYVHCAPNEELKETENMRLFKAGKLPANMVEPHRTFAESFFENRV